MKHALEKLGGFQPVVERLRRWHIGRRLGRHLHNWREVRDAYFAQTPVPPLEFHRGLRLQHSAHDGPVFLLLEIFDDEVYRPRKGWTVDCILDLGANIGFFCAWASTRYPEAAVFAFEPSAATFRKLEANVAQNRLKRVVIRNEAAAGSSGVAEFLDSETSMLSSLSQVSLPVQKTGVLQTVLARSLAECIQVTDRNRVDLCKMDVEGAEVEILQGASADTLRQVREFIIEVHDDRIPGALKTCTEMLVAAGFACQSYWLQKGELSMLRAWRNP